MKVAQTKEDSGERKNSWAVVVAKRAKPVVVERVKESMIKKIDSEKRGLRQIRDSEVIEEERRIEKEEGRRKKEGV